LTHMATHFSSGCPGKAAKIICGENIFHSDAPYFSFGLSRRRTKAFTPQGWPP
jgi:hypothetical protein